MYALLSKPPKFQNPEAPQGPLAAVGGQWEARLEFGRGSASHTLVLEQHGANLQGTHHGEFVAGDLNGTVAGNQVRFRSSQKIQGTRLSYEFTGTVDGDKMSGMVDLGEYGDARWSAQRHQYREPGGVVRPLKNV